MLTPDQLEALPRRFVQLWQQVEDDILQDIARRMKSLGELDPLTPTAIWQAWRLAETRAVRSNTVATLAKYTGKSRAEIKRLLETAGAQTLAADDAVYAAAGLDPPPVNQSPALLNLLNAGYRQTCGTWQNLTATTANTVTSAFEDRLSRAWGLVSTGAMDYNTAIRRAVDDLADTMPYIIYPSGHTDALEVAARRAVLTGVNQTCAKLQLARMEEMDCEFVEVTAHEGARPTHAVWQGRVYHRGGAVVQDGERYEDFEAATGYGTGPGLCGWCCRHNFYPFYKEHWDYIRTKALTSGKSGAIVKQEIEADLREYVHNQLASDPAYIRGTVSRNAANGFQRYASLNELIADALLQKDKGVAKDSVLLKLVEGVVYDDSDVR